MTKDPKNELERLEGMKIADGLTLHLEDCVSLRGREKETRHFQVVIQESPSLPVVTGLFSVGRESIRVKSYFDIDFNYLIPNDQGILDLSRNGSDVILFNKLSMLVEEGGKMIVALTTPREGPLIKESFRAIDIGYPPEVSYIGSLLYYSGCGDFFKLWLIREGGMEGPPALQGEKALDQVQVRSCREKSRIDLRKFIKIHESENDPMIRTCIDRANDILRGPTLRN